MFEWQKSGFNMVKIHAMSHFDDCIRRSRLPWEYSTNMYEQMHITLMKAGYRASNKRQATPQIARHNQRLGALHKLQDTMEGFDNMRQKEKYTALDQAVETSLNVLWGAKVNLQSSWLDPTCGFTFDSSQLFISKSARNLICQQPELQTYSTKLYKFTKLRTISQVEKFFMSLHL